MYTDPIRKLEPGLVLDRNDASLTGGIVVTRTRLMAAANEEPAATFVVTEDMSEEEIVAMMLEGPAMTRPALPMKALRRRPKRIAPASG